MDIFDISSNGFANVVQLFVAILIMLTFRLNYKIFNTQQNNEEKKEFENRFFKLFENHNQQALSVRNLLDEDEYREILGDLLLYKAYDTAYMCHLRKVSQIQEYFLTLFSLLAFVDREEKSVFADDKDKTMFYVRLVRNHIPNHLLPLMALYALYDKALRKSNEKTDKTNEYMLIERYSLLENIILDDGIIDALAVIFNEYGIEAFSETRVLNRYYEKYFREKLIITAENNQIKIDENGFLNLLSCYQLWGEIDDDNHFFGYNISQDFKKIIDLANKGDEQSQVYLGFMYYQGIGCHQDVKKAKQLFCKLAKQNNKIAQFYLGRISYESQDYAQAAKLFFEVASVRDMEIKGDSKAKNLKILYSEAEYYLGVMFDNGYGVKQNERLSFYWYCSAYPQCSKSKEILQKVPDQIIKEQELKNNNKKYYEYRDESKKEIEHL